MKSELNKILEKLKLRLKYIPYLYKMDINFCDDIPSIIVCWRQWIELERKADENFTTITLESKRQCVEVVYGFVQTNYPINILQLKIERKIKNYIEPCKDIIIDWKRINNKYMTNIVCFPVGKNDLPERKSSNS